MYFQNYLVKIKSHLYHGGLDGRPEGHSFNDYILISALLSPSPLLNSGSSQPNILLTTKSLLKELFFFPILAFLKSIFKRMVQVIPYLKFLKASHRMYQGIQVPYHGLHESLLCLPPSSHIGHHTGHVCHSKTPYPC